MQQTQSPENIFKQKIMNLSYDYLRTTYPNLMPYGITLKLDNYDINEGKAAAVYIIKRGSDIAYIPIVISGNTILSCEMVYYKNENRMFPLISKEVSKIVSANEMQPNTLVKSPKINTTYNFFRNMYRPPVTEKISLASDTDGMLSNLPNKYKEAIKNTLINDKNLLKKIAEFYPITELLDKLAPKENDEDKYIKALQIPKIANLDDVKTVLTRDDLNGKTTKFITKEAAADIVNKGYHVLSKVAYDKSLLLADDVLKNICASGNIREMRLSNYLDGITGDIYVILDGKLTLLKDAIIVGTNLYHSTGTYRVDVNYALHSDRMVSSNEARSIVVRNARSGICPKLFKAYGARYVESFFANLKGDNTTKYTEIGVCIAVPAKKEGYRYINSLYKREDGECCNFGSPKIHFTLDDLKVLTAEDDTTIINLRNRYKTYGDEVTNITVSDDLRYSIVVANTDLIIPSKSLAIKASEYTDKEVSLPTIEQVVKYLKSKMPKYTLISSTSTFALKKEGNLERTFNKEASAVDYIHKYLDISPQDIDTLIKKASVPHVSNVGVDFYILEKNAATFDLTNGNQQGIVQQNLGLQSMTPATMAYKPNGNNPNLAGQGLPPIVDSNTIDIYSNGLDKTMMDIGILSSLYNNEDIKTYLLDYVPQFTETVSNLGKVLLLFNLNKDALIGKYGNGEYHSILSTVRKVFRSLAEIILDLERYVATLATLPEDKQVTNGLRNNAKVNTNS